MPDNLQGHVATGAYQGYINNSLGGTAWGGYCPHCAPKCPCCGRPLYGYNYWPYYGTPQVTCGGLSSMQSTASSAFASNKQPS